MVRITLGGPSLAGFVNGGLDQRVKLLLPLPGQSEPLMPEGEDDFAWYQHWRTMDPAVRPVLRTYTVRAQRHDPDEVDIDIAVNGDHGPGSRWAEAAAPGDRVVVCGPAVEEAAWRRVPAARRGGLGAAGGGRVHPAGRRRDPRRVARRLPVRVFAEVEGPTEHDYLPADRPGTTITWLHRGTPGTPALPAAVGAAELPSGTPYAWIAGEAAAVRTLRRHLVGERGYDRRAVCFMGYWRLGSTEDQRADEPVETDAD